MEDERSAAKKEIRKVFGQLTPEGRRMVAECLEEVERTKGRGATRSGGLLEAVHDGHRILYRVKSWVEIVGVVAEDQQT